MPLHIVRNDITHMAVDAIVNAAKSSLLGGGGVDGAIHAAAGPELLEACRALGGCGVGQAKITEAYRLPCRYVIHTVGPRWRGGLLGERRQLASCYREALALAEQYGCETVAFPLISAGTYGYPKDKAMKVALDTIGDFLLQKDMTVYLVLFGQESTALGHKLSADIKEYIDEHYVREHRPPQNRRERYEKYEESMPIDPAWWEQDEGESIALPSLLEDAAQESVPFESSREDAAQAHKPLQSPRESAWETDHRDTGAFSWPASESAPKAKKTEAARRADKPVTAPALPGPMASVRPPMPYAAAKQGRSHWIICLTSSTRAFSRCCCARSMRAV